MALPVNFVADHDDIVFRTEAWSSILASTYAGPVSFEVDEVDHDSRTGGACWRPGTCE